MYAQRMRLVLTMVALYTVAGCSDQQAVTEVDVEALEARLIASPEFQQLNLLKNDVLMRLATREISKDQFVEMVNSNDEAMARELLGYAPEEAAFVSAQLQASLTGLRVKFPELTRFEAEVKSTCGTDRVDTFLANYDAAMVSLREGHSFIGKSQAVDCEYSPYTACLALAGWTAGASVVTGPVAVAIYGVGAYVCLCGFCEGGWIDWVCT